MNEISWRPKALKQIEKIKIAAVRKRIFIETQTLAYFPNCQGVKKLANHNYRLRIGDYRVFFEFDGSVHIIDIQEVKKRNENTY